MVANAIFRMGGAAVLLSNQARYYSAAKYELLHNVRVHTGQDDASYKCMGWGPDGGGVNGVYLRKDIPSEAAKALEHCLRDVAPRILTWRQCAAAAGSLAARRLLGAGAVPEFVPDFTRCVDHFALHAGGFAVLKGLQAAMRLPLEKMLPSFATLRDFGNTSCSTTCARARVRARAACAAAPAARAAAAPSERPPHAWRRLAHSSAHPPPPPPPLPQVVRARLHGDVPGHAAGADGDADRHGRRHEGARRGLPRAGRNVGGARGQRAPRAQPTRSIARARALPSRHARPRPRARRRASTCGA